MVLFLQLYNYYGAAGEVRSRFFQGVLARVCAVAKLLRGLEPWLLSLEKAPDVAIASKASSIVDARAFSSDGKLRVLVTACGPGKAEAVITVPGKTNLKSRFGNIRPLGGGKYLFCGDDICSDILME